MHHTTRLLDDRRKKDYETRVSIYETLLLIL